MNLYLAAPYSHPDPAIRQQRFEQINAVAADLIRQGRIVFSPISMGHPICNAGDLPLDWSYWQKVDRAFIEWCDMLLVLRLPGWGVSKGVQEEIDIATRLGKPVKYL